jgi:FAD synthase
MLNEVKKRGRGIVVTFGRFQPPTSGHEKVVDKVLSVAKRMGFDSRIYTSPSQNNAKNPLRYKDKVRFLRAMFPKATIHEDAKIINPFYMMKQLSDQGYRNVVLIVGGDRIENMEKEISKYIKHKDKKKSFEFDNFKVVSSGKRDPDAEGTTGMSGTKMRAAVQDDDFELFTQGLPRATTKRLARSLFNAIRKAI